MHISTCPLKGRDIYANGCKLITQRRIPDGQTLDKQRQYQQESRDTTKLFEYLNSLPSAANSPNKKAALLLEVVDQGVKAECRTYFMKSKRKI